MLTHSCQSFLNPNIEAFDILRLWQFQERFASLNEANPFQRERKSISESKPLCYLGLNGTKKESPCLVADNDCHWRPSLGVVSCFNHSLDLVRSPLHFKRFELRLVPSDFSIVFGCSLFYLLVYLFCISQAINVSKEGDLKRATKLVLFPLVYLGILAILLVMMALNSP